MAVRIGIVGEKNAIPLWDRERKAIAAALAEKVMPALRPTLPGELLPERYPWCFVLPPLRKKGRFYTGALVKDGAAFYTAASYSWLQKELATNFHIAFWLARIMATQHRARSSDISVQGWLKLLQSRYSPLRERLLNDSYKFSSHAELLLAGLCDYDEIATEEKGVSRMPWPGWPQTIAADSAWLWRQSRYGKIIDSQQIKW